MTPPKPPLVIHFQQFWGTGHRVRMSRLAAALAGKFEVSLLDGGRIEPEIAVPEGVRRIRLEPLLREPSGVIRPCRDGISLRQALALRRRTALAVIGELRPAALVVEFYPFSRLNLAVEIEALMAATRALRPEAMVFASVRDFLATGFEDSPHSRPEKHEALVARLRRLDGLLLHAEPANDLWDAHLPAVAEAAIPVVHTGYIGPRLDGRPPAAARIGTALSVGGGIDGSELISATLALWRGIGSLPFPRDLQPLTVYLGPYLPAAAARRIESECRALGVRCSPYADDFCQILATAALSISRAGYNTCMDIVASGVRAVVSPSLINDQLPRARRLAALGRVAMAADSDESLQEAIDRALALDAGPPPFALDGAAVSTEWIVSQLARRRLA